MNSQILTSSTKLIIFFLFTTTTAPPSSAASTTQSIIRKACKPTPHPLLCQTSISLYASKPNPTPQDLCIAAVTSALKSAQNATSAISALRRKASPDEVEVVEDCVENLRDSVDAIRRVEKAFKSFNGGRRKADVEFLMNSIKTWMSAAETDVVSCADGLDGGRRVSSRVKSAVKKSAVIVIRQISNALSLVNNFKFKS